MSRNPNDAPPATVRKAGDWHLVTYGTWQISVGPDGLLMLPRHLHPDEWDHFVATGTIAKTVASDVISKNQKQAEADDRSLPVRRAIVQQGPPPPGATRMRVTTAQQRGATIGRSKRRRSTEKAEPPRPTRNKGVT